MAYVHKAPARAARKPIPRIDGAASRCAAELLAVMPGLMDHMRAAMRRQIGETLSVPQFRCLSFISRTDGCSVGDVAAFLGVTMPTASAMVERLTKADYVEGRTSDADRRRTELHIRPAGKTLMQHIERGAQHEFALKLAARSADELKTVMKAMALVREAFDHEA